MASHLYTQLRDAAETFVVAYDFPAGQTPNIEGMKSTRSSTYTQRWGHARLISQNLMLQGVIDMEGFLRHLEYLMPNMESVSSKIHDVLVDEHKRKVTVLMSYFLRPKGAEEAVENDLVWILEIDDSGEKVQSGIEYMDATAFSRIGELIQAANT